MNYIQHLDNFYQQLDRDPRIKPLHIALYMALCQTWKYNSLVHSFIMSRTRLMQMSRIGSKATFAKVLRELHDFGLIKYEPSGYTAKKPMITMLIYHEMNCPRPENETDPVHDMNIPCSNNETAPVHRMNTPCPDNGTDPVPKVEHIDKHINNNKRENLSSLKKNIKEKKMTPPDLDEAISWFVKNDGTAEVAKLFFQNYTDNGWEMADGPMKNWKSAATKWIFNSKNKTGNGKSNYLYTDNYKDYGEPL